VSSAQGSLIRLIRMFIITPGPIIFHLLGPFSTSDSRPSIGFSHPSSLLSKSCKSCAFSSHLQRMGPIYAHSLRLSLLCPKTDQMITPTRNTVCSSASQRARFPRINSLLRRRQEDQLP
jgi:hypothetical protein